MDIDIFQYILQQEKRKTSGGLHSSKLRDVLQDTFIQCIENNEIPKVKKLLKYAQDNCLILSVGIDELELLFGQENFQMMETLIQDKVLKEQSR